jgi:hypothetical protein
MSTCFSRFSEKILGETSGKTQANLGQFHTRDRIVDIVLSSFPDDWCERLVQGASLIDPSCGTGNFLIGVIRGVWRHLEANRSESEVRRIINKKVVPNLKGAEIDPVLCKTAKMNILGAFGGQVEVPEISTLDSLDLGENEASHEAIKRYGNKFDFVVGNPPWVEVKRLPDAIKGAVQEKYFVSNLYGAFIVQGTAFLKKGGFLSYVVPRSFTGGRYYYKLRELLMTQTSIREISYFANRNQKFHGGDVLQELVVICFAKVSPGKHHEVVCKPCKDLQDFSTKNGFRLRQADLFSRHDLMMLLAGSRDEFEWMMRVSSFASFEEHGFVFSTGQLVLHRSKDFLRSNSGHGAYRILYGHDILNDNGRYYFQTEVEPVKGRYPYAVCEGKKNLDGRRRTKVIDEISSIENYRNRFGEIIICRRRSHKGDKRRFVGVYLRKALPEGYFLENGLNFVAVDIARHRKTAPSLAAFFGILCSDLFERYFNIVSSNTQLNKNDMYLLGIPDVGTHTKSIYAALEKLDWNDLRRINPLVEKLYRSGSA